MSSLIVISHAWLMTALLILLGCNSGFLANESSSSAIDSTTPSPTPAPTPALPVIDKTFTNTDYSDTRYYSEAADLNNTALIIKNLNLKVYGDGKHVLTGKLISTDTSLVTDLDINIEVSLADFENETHDSGYTLLYSPGKLLQVSESNINTSRFVTIFITREENDTTHALVYYATVGFASSGKNVKF